MNIEITEDRLEQKTRESGDSGIDFRLQIPPPLRLPTSLALRRTSRRASAGDIDGDGELTVLDIDQTIA
jgi:hypothetical protein